MRASLALVLVMLPLLPARAAEQEAADWTIRLTVAPAAAPSPALRYPLLPELRDQSPGNAALLYYRAFSPDWLSHRRPEVQKSLLDWLNDRSKQPGPEHRWVLTYNPLKEVDLAARRVYCDWELNERARREGIYMLLPDVQSMREFANLLSLRVRYQMDAGDHDGALRTLQTALSMSRHISDAPTLIQSLVGLACTNIMLGELERWIEKPGAPNLYWSLTTLPAPFIDLRKPMQGEKFFLENMFPGVREAMAQRKPTHFPTDKLHKTLRELDGMRHENGEAPLPELASGLGLALYAAKSYPEAKKTLLGQGWKQKDVEALPVVQAAVMSEVLNYDRAFDDLSKWVGLPYWQARPGMVRADEKLRQLKSQGGAGHMLALLLVPATQKVVFSGARTDRKIAALRCIEALRLYAAVNDGKLPAKLADITDVPIPNDPVTGKEFEYRVEDGKVLLSGPAPSGERPHQGNTLKYEITIKK